jgi:uncharacterized membrane protein YfcA
VSTVLLAVPLGFAIGAVLGMLGAGGSVLAVPALVYLLDQPVTAATAASLAVVSANAAVGAGVNWRRGSVDVRLAAAFSATGLAGALAGSALSRLVSGEAVLFLLALLMISSAAVLWRRPEPRPGAGRREGAGRAVQIALTGLAVGVLTGFFGVGGGFVIVPALVLLIGLPLRLAVGTSLLIIAAVSFTGFLGHLGAGSIDWAVTAAFGLGGVAGALTGSALATRVPTRALGRAFAVMLVLLAAFLMVKNAGALAG